MEKALAAAVTILNEPLGGVTVVGMLCVIGAAILGAIGPTPPGVRRG